VKLWCREREQPVEADPELEHRIADVLHRHATYRGRDSVLYAYKAEARQRQKVRAAARKPTATEASQSRSSETPVAAAPQPHPPNLTAEPSPPPAPVPAPNFEREQLTAFEVLCGNSHRLNERLQEIRDFDPDDELPEPRYLLNGFE